MKKAIIYGSGNIGRGLLAELLNNKYAITFVDINDKIISKLINNSTYNIIYSNGSNKNLDQLEIKNFNAINSHKDKEQLNNVINQADLILTAIGLNNLKFLNNDLLTILNKNNFFNNKTIIACENGIRATSQWAKLLSQSLKKEVLQKIQFIDCVVDRIIPYNKFDTLDVIVEPYKSIILDNSQNKFHLQIDGFNFQTNFKQFLERKLFLLNSLHCYIAWKGLDKNIKYIDAAIDDQDIKKNAIIFGQEIIKILHQKHKLDIKILNNYLKQVLQRFSNKALMDSCSRVGRGVLRKLSFNNNFITLWCYAQKLQIYTPQLIEIIKLGFTIKNNEDPEVVKRDDIIQNNPTRYIKKITGIILNDISEQH